MAIYTAAVPAVMRPVVEVEIDSTPMLVQLRWYDTLGHWLADIYSGTTPLVTATVVEPYQRLIPGRPEIQVIVAALAEITADMDSDAFAVGWQLYFLTDGSLI